MFLVQKAIQSHHFRSPVTKPPQIPKPNPNPNLLTPQLLNQNIINHLKTLDLSPDSSNISLISLSEAVTCLSKLHSEAEAHINQDLYMDYSFKVLDLCNLISSAVNQLTNQRILINYSLRLLEYSGELPAPEKLIKAKDALTRFVVGEAPATEKGLRAKALIEDLIVLIDNLPRGNGNGNEIDLVRRLFYTTVFVGSVLVTVLFRVDSVNGELDRIIDWVKVKRNVVLEVDDVARQAVVVRDLVEAVVNGGDDEGVRVRLEDGVKEMAVKAKRFSDGVDALTNGVNGLFRTVLKIRNTV